MDTLTEGVQRGVSVTGMAPSDAAPVEFRATHEGGRLLSVAIPLYECNADIVAQAVQRIAAEVKRLIDDDGLQPQLCAVQSTEGIPGVATCAGRVHGVPVRFMLHFSHLRQEYILVADILAGIAES